MSEAPRYLVYFEDLRDLQPKGLPGLFDDIPGVGLMQAQEQTHGYLAEVRRVVFSPHIPIKSRKVAITILKLSHIFEGWMQFWDHRGSSLVCQVGKFEKEGFVLGPPVACEVIHLDPLMEKALQP